MWRLDCWTRDFHLLFESILRMLIRLAASCSRRFECHLVVDALAWLLVVRLATEQSLYRLGCPSAMWLLDLQIAGRDGALTERTQLSSRQQKRGT